jgi:hypothetical protein
MRRRSVVAFSLASPPYRQRPRRRSDVPTLSVVVNSQPHCIVSAALGAVLVAKIGTSPAPKLSSASSTAGGAVRSWASVSDFTQEVALARILDGVHYRNSIEVGTAMGKKIGELGVQKLPKATH